MEQKFGIENLKKAIGWACSFNEELASALKDKKFRWIEAFGFIDDVLGIEGLVKAIPQIKNEIAELSHEENHELKEYISENFTFENSTVEEVIDAAFDFLSGATKLINAFKK